MSFQEHKETMLMQKDVEVDMVDKLPRLPRATRVL